MALRHVKQSSIVKIALLLATLVSVPKTIFIYDMVSQGGEEFSVAWIADFMYRFVFLFLFSWTILQLNANVGYAKYKWQYLVSRFLFRSVSFSIIYTKVLLYPWVFVFAFLLAHAN
mgnify:CR=1 FL=1